MRFGLVALIALALSGCAVHVPMSEVLVFRTAGSAFEDVGDADAPAATVATDAEDGTINPRGLGMALHRTAYGESASAVSASIGFGVVGVDATVRISEAYYVLASGSILGGTQAFVLVRAPLPSRNLGLSLGAGPRCRYGVRREDPEFVFGVEFEGSWSCSAGGRAAVAWFSNGDFGGVLGTVYVGYGPSTGVVASLGIAGIPL